MEAFLFKDMNLKTQLPIWYTRLSAISTPFFQRNIT